MPALRSRETTRLLAFVLALFGPGSRGGAEPGDREARNLRLAIEDLQATYGTRYPRAGEFLAELAVVESARGRGDPAAGHRLELLRREALLANPLLRSRSLIVLKRAVGEPPENPLGTRAQMALGLPSNHECNSSLDRLGYDNEIALLSPIGPDGALTALYRPADEGYVGEIDLHWDASRLLFSKSDARGWGVWEVRSEGGGLCRVSRLPEGVDGFDPCYLPDGRIVFGSTAPFQSVPCWHGQRVVSNLYLMGADGGGLRRLCFDQDHDFHPTVLASGQVLYNRWDYTGINHVFLRQLMVMNPDGTGQRAVYGQSSWYPNALYFPKELPGRPGSLVCILSGYHGVHRMGQLVLVDTRRGWHGADGIVLRISGRGDPVDPKIRDRLVDDDWPKFLHPWPLSDKHFLVSAWTAPHARWGIYLADVFDNLVLVREEPGYALLEPILLAERPRPPPIPDRVDLSRRDALVYLHDVHGGPGLRGVPRGTVTGLRVIAYDFGYPGLAGPDKVGRGGPWEIMRILGTVPLEADGSALFRVPAATPIAFQALDADGRAVQLMRSWLAAMPGETVSCAGCHEGSQESPPPAASLAALREPTDIVPWRGPPRGFDFEREVQPVLDVHCAPCHDGSDRSLPDLRPSDAHEDYRGLPLSDLSVERLHPRMREALGGNAKYAPAYEALIPYVRRVGVEDDVHMLLPGELHVDTSELVQLLSKGHEGIRLDREAWDRIVTWIDLNAPCHGTWGEVFPIPDGVHRLRMELVALCGGPPQDPEGIPQLEPYRGASVAEGSPPRPAPNVAGWPFGADVARTRQEAAGPAERELDLGDGTTLRLVRIPAGSLVLGDPRGEPDELPLASVTIEKPFWLGAFEVTNRQYRRFDPSHDPAYYAKRHAREDDQGLPLNHPDQPAVRVSWYEAMAFCEWLSERTGIRCSLPTEAQWEHACRAGCADAMHYGDVAADFSPWANVGDRSFGRGLLPGGRQVTGGLEHLVVEGAALAEERFDDGAVVTAPVGSYRPNSWGLYDLHGNAAEWTLTAYRPYPYCDEDGRNGRRGADRRAVRGGSFFDRPERCRSAFRLAYPPWRKIFCVGFRVACED